MYSQKTAKESYSRLTNWGLGLKAGTLMILSPVPEKYVDKTNYVNIPVGIPGPMMVFSLKKGLSPHWGMGYQYSNVRIQGMAPALDANRTEVEVRTNGKTHAFLIEYHLKKTTGLIPRWNYSLYYKVGAISLRNTPLEPLPDGLPGLDDEDYQFSNNVAVLTGMGLEVNHQLNRHLSLAGTFEVNRSSDHAQDVWKIHKLFYNSSNAVNFFISLNAGISYRFDLGSRKKVSVVESGIEPKKKVKKVVSSGEKKKMPKSHQSIWYKKPKNPIN